ncbi:MAG: THUMP domain-containing protein [Candidatus Bathyarchaeota archaeon]|nr:THUMP domain-containing protein [Candidatus Bathyarchaeota archaeon]MDH5787371.1 THUMP domain-containing protein [Candidatus Bathyarchaeota archaeon]
MARLFFLLSGEHETLPASELKAILQTEGYVFTTLEKLDQALRIEADLRCIEAIRSRAALTRLCGLEMVYCKADTNKILKSMRSINLKRVLKEGEGFAVRIKRVKNYSPEIQGMALERRLGKVILDKAEKAKVDLEKPDKVFLGVLTEEKLILGQKLGEISPKSFVERRPRKKPFFHPSAMPPKLARCMVNLARPKVGELVFDPFCGTGSMLIEAALIDCHVLGLDIQKRMVKGSLENFAYFNINSEGIIVADARDPPIARTDCVVTDPPYGRSATTFRRTTAQLVKEVLMAASALLKKGQRVCIAAPKTLEIQHTGTTLGYKHLESHFVYVHRSLTREIAVFEKV